MNQEEEKQIIEKAVERFKYAFKEWHESYKDYLNVKIHGKQGNIIAMFRSGAEYVQELCSEAHKKEIEDLHKSDKLMRDKLLEKNNKIIDMKNEIEKLKRNLNDWIYQAYMFDDMFEKVLAEKQAMTESIDTLQRKIDEGTRKLIEEFEYMLNKSKVTKDGFSKIVDGALLHNLEISIKELRQTLGGKA